MDYISKISEIYFHLNDQMIELSEDRIQFFPYDTFKEASESDLIPFEYHDEPESFWSVLSNGMQGYYADEFGEVLRIIEKIGKVFYQSKALLAQMNIDQLVEWTRPHSDELEQMIYSEFTRIRKDNS